jgi:hypothetical protein
MTARAVVLLAFCAAALVVQPARARVGPAKFWTVKQATSIAEIRATPLYGRRCAGLGAGRVIAGERRYRHFACSGWTAPRFAPERKVYVAYRLHPLGKYRGPRSPAAVTHTKFTAVGVP